MALLTSSFFCSLLHVVILSGASRRFILPPKSAFSISGSGCEVEESLLSIAKTGDVNKSISNLKSLLACPPGEGLPAGVP